MPRQPNAFIIIPADAVRGAGAAELSSIARAGE